MSKIAIVEKGVVVYRGGLPKNWKNSSGLHNSKNDWVALAELGIYPLEEVFPSYDNTTEVLEGWTEDIQADKVILTWIKRSITDAEVAASAELEAAAYKYSREREYPEIADQLDMIWHAIDTGADLKLSQFYVGNKLVKDTYAKPIT